MIPFNLVTVATKPIYSPHALCMDSQFVILRLSSVVRQKYEDGASPRKKSRDGAGP